MALHTNTAAVGIGTQPGIVLAQDTSGWTAMHGKGASVWTHRDIEVATEAGGANGPAARASQTPYPGN